MGKYKSIFNRSPTYDYGPSGMSPMALQGYVMGQKSMISAIIEKIAISVANGMFMHAVVGENGIIKSKPDSFLNHAFTTGPNVNQTGIDFIIDIVNKMCTYGAAAVVATKTDDLDKPCEFVVGVPTEWRSRAIQVELFNNEKQDTDYVWCEKMRDVAILINPYYSGMNAGGSAIQRLNRKLNELDVYSNKVTGSKINAVLSIPQDVAMQQGMEFAKKSIKAIDELSNYTYNKYGFIVTGSKAEISFPNKQIEPGIFDEVKQLHSEVYAQLGMPESVFLGTATEEEIRGYEANTVEIFWKTIRWGLTKVFLAGRTNEQVVVYRSMFAGVTGQNMGDMVDKLARNSMIDPNECRGQIGLIASNDPLADSLANKNMPMQDQLGGMGDAGQSAPSNNIFSSGGAPAQQKPASANIFDTL